jgi:hypothetical protein
MDKNRKILFVSVGLIGLGLYYFYKQSKQNAELAQTQSNQNDSVVGSKPDWNKVLELGSVGVEVERLQKALKQLTVDGQFGAKTEARLKNVLGITKVSINQYNELLKNKK